MTVVIPTDSEPLLLEILLNITAATTPVLHLYSNDLDLDKDTVLGDFTEAANTGYATISLSSGNWTIDTDVDGVTTATYDMQTFTFTSGGAIYGYYVTNAGGTELLWAERDANGATFPVGGGILEVTVNLALN